MPWEDWAAATRPKILGTWNLHHALLREQPEPLEQFFLFSSGGAMAGNWGQSNYCAGNTFLDAFVRYRHSMGLAASSLAIGAIEDVGYVAENPEIFEKVRSTAGYMMGQRELLESIELMLKRSAPGSVQPKEVGATARYVEPSQTSIGVRSLLPITSPSNRVVWRRDPRMLVYRNVEAQAGGADGGGTSSLDQEVTQFLKEISDNLTLLRAEESAVLLANAIGRTLLGFMMRESEELDIDAPLASMGIDSLVSLEVRNWVRRRLGADVTVLEIVRSENLRQLGVTVQGKLVEKQLAKLG